MAVYSIICEYNPFHNGHKFQIDSLKPDTVVCLMSSNFVQRGDLAVCDKYTRARAAVECGADLVLELPFPYSMMSAEYFALAGVDILTRLGFVDYLSFGCESESFQKLEDTARYLISDNYERDISDIFNKNPSMPYAVAREKAVALSLGEEFSQILRKPNNILGIEYIKAILKVKSPIIPKPMLRRFVDHNDTSANGVFASAGAIRKMLLKGEDISSFVPEQAKIIYDEAVRNGIMPADIKKLENAIIAFLRMLPLKQLSKYYDCSAVAEIIKKAAAQSVTLEELFDRCATKSFTRARIRRCILSAYFGIEETAAHAEPLYTNVLALNEKGAQLLSSTRKKRSVTVITKPAHVNKYKNTELYHKYMFSVAAEDVCSLALPAKQKGGEGLKKTPFVL